MENFTKKLLLSEYAVNNSEDNSTLEKQWFVFCGSLLEGTRKEKSLLITKVNSSLTHMFL
jgi:hypothetical protein